MKNYAIALGFKGKLYKDILTAWKILENKMNIKYMSTDHALPHITIVAGKTNNIEEIYKVLNNIKIKKFRLKSPGLGIFANQDPNLYIRWEQSLDLVNISNLIINKTSKYFKTKYQSSDNSLWVPKTTLAWQDLDYKDLNLVFDKINFLFNKSLVVIDYIYLIDFTHKEVVTHKIKLQ